MKKTKKTGFFKKKDFNLGDEKILLNLIIMKEFKPQAVKLKGETTDKLKNLQIEVAGVELSTYDDKINHLVWFFEKYRKKHKQEIEDGLI